MADSATTRPSLLLRIRDTRDAAAWSQFVELYAPLVYGFARRHGLQDADAADLTQDVLRAVARSARSLQYDRRRGSFRGWLFTIVRNELRDFFARRARQAQGTGDSSAQEWLDAQPGREEGQAAWWDQEQERRLFHWAAEQVRQQVQETTWQAFWLTAVEGKSGQEVAASLKLTVAAVYLAKSRVMAKLKEIIRETNIEN